MKYFHLSAIAVTLTMLCAGSLMAQKVIQVPTDQPAPTIDGVIAPAEKAASAMTTLTLAGSFDRGSNPTEVYVSLTKDGLYVGFICADTAVNPQACKAAKENGPVFLDDSVEVYLAPALEAGKTNYYHFALNTMGTAYSNYVESDAAVAGWTHAVRCENNGWQAEMLIPYQSIRATTSLPYWRANFARNRLPRGNEKEENSVWVDPGTTMHNYKRFGYLRFAAGVPVPATPDSGPTTAPVAPSQP
jgi:hypothetical protein